MTASIGKRVVKCAGILFRVGYECQAKRQMTGIGGIWFEIRLKFCPIVVNM